MKNSFIKYLTVLGLWSISFASFGQQNDFWSLIEGEWKGTGNLFGASASFEMSWSNELNANFVKLEFKNSFERSGQTYEMTALAMYKVSGESISGTWFDSRGQVLPLKSELIGDVLTTYWGDEKTEKGKTTYSLESMEMIVVQDFVMKEGEYQLFGQASYDKK